MINSLKNSAPQKRCRNDMLLILGIILAVGLLSIVYFTTKKDGAYAVITKNGEEIGIYSLSEDIKIPIKDGEEITNTLVIKDGKAYMESAVCPDQICVKHRVVSKANETIVCLPSKIVVKIIAEQGTDGPDTVV